MLSRTVVLRLIVLYVFSTLALAQSVKLSSSQFTGKGVLAAEADLNGDGVADIISVGSNASGKSGFFVTLSEPGGSYAAPVFYTSPYIGGGASIALGDFNRDGRVDVAEIEGGRSYYIFLNRGNGVLQSSWNFSNGPSSANYNIVTADFNHDGKLDLIFFNAGTGTLQLLYGSGYGTFSSAFNIATADVDQLFVGDYDSDGNADIATKASDCGPGGDCGTHIRVYYGNGKGGFSAPTKIDYSEVYNLTSDNVKEDAFSDLVGVLGSSLLILHGNSNRTFTEQNLSLAGDATGVPVAVDLNGDGIRDIALVEGSDVIVLLGNSDGTYQPEQTVYSASGLQTLLAGRYNNDTKPDLIVSDMAGTFAGSGNFYFLINNTTGMFPSCNAPGSAMGIAVCSPAGGTIVVWPVKFAVSAAYTSPLRKTEIWVDGVKLKESFNSYGNYSFLDGRFNLATGTHRADIFSAGYDNRLQLKTVYFTVGTSPSLQYDVSLFPMTVSNPLPRGQVTVTTSGVTTIQLSQAAINQTYTVQFCAAPGQLYPTCIAVGSITTNGNGSGTNTVAFPSGSWAGDFELLLDGTPEYSTSLIQGVASVYYATLQQDTGVNGKGTWIFLNPPPSQAPLKFGSVSLAANGLLSIIITGASSDTSYSATQCPINRGSSCYAVQTGSTQVQFSTDGQGNAFYAATPGTNIPEDIFYVEDTTVSKSGYVAGFSIP